jgi:hypothetical protein
MMMRDDIATHASRCKLGAGAEWFARNPTTSTSVAALQHPVPEDADWASV